MTYDTLLLDDDAGVVTLTLNRPEKRNALSATTLGELHHAASEIGRDEAVRCLVITGAGDRAFSAGADISEFRSRTPEAATRWALEGQRTFARIESLGKPVIAAIAGVALGGGCELAMACTFRIAAQGARLGQPEIRLGLVPGFGGLQRLARLVGRDRALDLVLTGRHVTADEAFRMGLVTRVVGPDEALPAARTFARELAGQPALAVRQALDAVNDGLDLPLAQAAAHDASRFGLLTTSDDVREGTQAFLEKRPPRFTGR